MRPDNRKTFTDIASTRRPYSSPTLTRYELSADDLELIRKSDSPAEEVKRIHLERLRQKV